MFDFVRNHTRLMLSLVLLLIIPSFVFFGVQGYESFTDGSRSAVARVDGVDITRAEWDFAHQRNVDRLRQQMPTVDASLLDTPQMRRETLDGLIRERVLLATASQLHLVPGDERLQRLFVTDPQFASLRNPDGSVNRDILAAQGMSSESFAQRLRQDFGMQQVMAGVASSAFAPASVAAPSLNALLQRREVQVQRFDAAAFRDKVNPTEADLEAYFKANEAGFRTAESADIEYVVLDLDTVMKGVSVPDEDLRRFFTENASRYTQAEERRASHILINADSAMPAPDRKKARAQAEALLAELRQNPSAFADLARKSSQDSGSASRGGDLDFFGRGSMVKPFEDAVFAMKAGEISNVIESDFGYHIITLTGVRGGEKRAFESVRAEIEAEVRKSLAVKRFAEVAEQFTNMVFEQPDSLQPVADKLKLEKRTATVQRSPAPGATGVLASAKLLEAVFGNDAVRNKRNTDAVETAPNQLVSARIVQHTPVRVPPLAEVKDRVRERVVTEQAAALARKEGAAQLEQMRKTPAQALAAPAVVVSRNQPQGLPRPLLDAVLRADVTALPVLVGVDLGEQGFSMARLTQVLPRDTPVAAEAQLVSQFVQAWSGAETQAYLGALKSRFKAVIKPAAGQAAASAPVP
jgi:peptidyl-prolyl cis-trans isomerase D